MADKPTTKPTVASSSPVSAAADPVAAKLAEMDAALARINAKEKEIDQQKALVDQSLAEAEQLRARLLTQQASEKATLTAAETPAQRMAAEFRMKMLGLKTKWRKRAFDVVPNDDDLPILRGLIGPDESDVLRQAAVCYGVKNSMGKLVLRAVEVPIPELSPAA